ncbi:MAG: hypothetical protein HPY53_02840 [Brevinematales bacterium]|nr:hypothetical protein [Brevinematales bacterium]
MNTTEKYTNGLQISLDYKHLIMNVGDHTGWSLHLPGGTIDTMQLRIVWTNVPSQIICTEPYTVWYPFSQLCSNTSTPMIYPGMPPVITGDNNRIFTNKTWYTTNGLLMTSTNEGNHTMEILLTIYPGTPRTVKYKLVNKFGWDLGQQTWDSFIALPTYDPGAIINVTNNFE